jgi:endonuclease/exonuclease/phosphatase family metal-dependent hydrolase
MWLLSWNICAGGGGTRRPKQLVAIKNAKPDIVALQEITLGSVDAYRDGLAADGFEHITDSFALAPSRRMLVGPRRYGQLIASRWPLSALPPKDFAIPWRERVLSCVVAHPKVGSIELHVTHVPPGSSNGWTKIRHLEGIYTRLATATAVPRILVGDLNTPKAEYTDGAIETWGGTPGRGNRWDAGERSVLAGLVEHDLHDVVRQLHGYKKQPFSIIVRGNKRRYDHAFASRSLHARSAEYLHRYRQAKLSDHAPLLVVFEPGRAPR